MTMAKCNKCLKGAKLSITGIDKRTLRIDIGGAVLYLMPTAKGMDVSINSENLVEGDYAYATWTGEQWAIAFGNGKSNCT
jgi:hypothetical protein